MDKENWPPCIVTLFDMVGTRSLAASGQGSSAMIQLQQRAVAKINHGMQHHAQGYVWNDSVLMLSYEAEPASARRKVLEELDGFKQWLQQECGVPLYAICVKGLAFPYDGLASPIFDGQIADQPRAMVLKTSSWAMANCFLIEEELKNNRADWYVDSRVTREAGLRAPFSSQDVSLLPKRELRKVDMFKGSLFD